MTTAAAEEAKTETAKTDAIATTTSADSIRQELDKTQGAGLPGARGALQLASQGVVLNNLDDAWRFATLIQSTGLAPKDMNTPAKILLAMQMGMEVGLPPMASIQNIAVINGRPSLWGDVCLGLCRKSGLFDEEAFKQEWEYDEQGNAIKAICTVRRLPNGQPIVSEFSWRDAIAAKLDAKDTYKSYRKRMLMNRARAFALRDGFADVLKGVLIAEEAQDLPPRDLTPQGPVAAKPASLDDLTEQLNGGNGNATAPENLTAEGAREMEQTGVAPNTTATTAAQPAHEESVTFGEVLVGLDQSLKECRYVSDVTKQRNTLLASRQYSEEERQKIEGLCEKRSSEIKNARKGKADEQSLLS